MNGGTGGQAQSFFERLCERAKRIEVDGETYRRVEGDTLLEEDQLRLYAHQREALQVAQAAMAEAGLPLVATAELVGMTELWANLTPHAFSQSAVAFLRHSTAN